MRTVEQIIAAGQKQREYQDNYRKSERGVKRQKAYNKLHNFENKVGLWIAAGQLPTGEPFSLADGKQAIKLAREEYEKAFGQLPVNKTRLTS